MEKKGKFKVSPVETREVIVNLHSDNFIKQLKKVQKEFEKLGNTGLTFSIEQEDEPIWHIIKRRIQKMLSKLTTK